ncbi:hypothetical protein AB1046_09005 [Promicromonospora sp. Populi]|uniref:hypothetical protein n=1 Tax=Promicromonospora sp. Populi TaxID=3239420 RepID=UPI0034E238B8
MALSTAPASADLSQCAPGQVCLWEDDSYVPGYYGIYGTANNMDAVRWSVGGRSAFVGNNSSSSAGYGNECNVSLYESANQSGHYFNYHRPSIGGTYRDPNHSNGAGWGPYAAEDWDNRVSSNRWYCA